MATSGEQPRVLLVVPAYNEAANIARVVATIEKAGYDFVVVNDGSTDDTLRILEENHIPHLNLRQNLGIGGAVQAGHRYAWLEGYDIDIQFDGDGQHDIAYVPALVQAIEEGADLAIGSRFVEQTEGFQSTRLRRVGIRWLSGCIRLCTGVRVCDPTSGFRASGRKVLELFAKDYPTDYPEPESIVSVLRHRLRVKEVSVVMHDRQGGASSIFGLKSAYYMIKVTLAIAINATARPVSLETEG